MIGDIVCIISKVSARDILKELIREDERFQRIPTMADAERLSADLNRERGMFIRPAYLLDVWQEYFKG